MILFFSIFTEYENANNKDDLRSGRELRMVCMSPSSLDIGAANESKTLTQPKPN